MLLLRGRELCSEPLTFETMREVEPARFRAFRPLEEYAGLAYDVLETGDIGCEA